MPSVRLSFFLALDQRDFVDHIFSIRSNRDDFPTLDFSRYNMGGDDAHTQVIEDAVDYCLVTSYSHDTVQLIWRALKMISEPI